MKQKLPRSHRSRPGEVPTPATPVFGTPASTTELLNKYGTYNVQPTADADNLFPMIAPGLPTRCRNFYFDKRDAEKFEP